MRILMVLTSHSDLGDSGEKTGFWIEEFAAPYFVFADAGAEITVASPDGGQPPVDPKSEASDAQTADTQRFYKDTIAIDKVAHSLVLADVNYDDYDAVFYPGGHGPLWDLAKDKHSIALIESFYSHHKPIAFVCHAPAALINTMNENGKPLIYEKNVTGFSNKEEEALNLQYVVPFILENALIHKGAYYSSGKIWESYTKQDGILITGQNPASSKDTALLLIKTLKNLQTKD